MWVTWGANTASASFQPPQLGFRQKCMLLHGVFAVPKMAPHFAGELGAVNGAKGRKSRVIRR